MTDDLIRRDEVERAVRLLSEAFIDGGSPTAAMVLNIAMDRVNALPAVQPDAAPAGNLTARGNAATWALYDALLTRMGALQPAHVNETPKSEHVPGDVLTPATGDA